MQHHIMAPVIVFGALFANSFGMAGAQSKDAGKLKQALQAFQRGDWDKSEPFLLTALEKGHADAPVILKTLAQGYRESFHIKKALAILEQWHKLEPNNPQPRLWRGEIREFLGKDQDALNDYQEVLKLASKNNRGRLRLAQILQSLGKIQEATELFKVLVTQQPKNPDALLGLARCHNALGQIEPAHRILQGLVKEHSENAVVLDEFAKLLLAEGRMAESGIYLRKALALQPGNHQILYHLTIHLRQLGKVAEARDYQHRLTAVQKDLVRLDEILGQIMGIAPSQGGTWTERSMSAKPLHLGAGPPPGNPDLWAEMGLILIKDHRAQEGLSWLQSALKKNPRHQASQQGLYETMRSQDARARLNAAAVLGKWKANDQVVVSVLIESMHEKNGNNILDSPGPFR